MCAGLVTVLWTVDTLTKLAERNQTGVGKETFRLLVEQSTSAVAALVMIGFVAYWLSLFPLRRDRWAQAIVGHTVGSGIFALGHYSLMVLLRVIVYGVSGAPYLWRPIFLQNLVVEYQKDIKIYVAAVLLISAYLYYQRVSSSKDAASALGQRLTVQTTAGERFVAHEDIDYLEAARNYVTVHSGGREYLLRETMTNLEKRLASDAFVRIHRSYIVRLDKVAAIQSIDSGYRVQLTMGAQLPLSRKFRDPLRARMQGGAAQE